MIIFQIVVLITYNEHNIAHELFSNSSVTDRQLQPAL